MRGDRVFRAQRPAAGGIVNADHGTQFIPCTLSQKIRAAGLLPSFETIGDAPANAVVEYIEAFTN